MFRLNRFHDWKQKRSDSLILPVSEQIRAWRKADRKMKWGFGKDGFAHIVHPPEITEEDRRAGFVGVILCYGFGDDGFGNADAVLSGKLAWEYALKRRQRKLWQCEYIDFDEKPENIRLNPEAPPRPKGFYFARFNPGKDTLSKTVRQVRKTLSEITCCAPEGFQMLAVTHPHLAEWMNRKAIHFFALADYDIAPHGFNDFYDVPQLFCSMDILGMGLGNVDRNYPGFGIPTIRLSG